MSLPILPPGMGPPGLGGPPIPPLPFQPNAPMGPDPIAAMMAMLGGQPGPTGPGPMGPMGPGMLPPGPMGPNPMGPSPMGPDPMLGMMGPNGMPPLHVIASQALLQMFPDEDDTGEEPREYKPKRTKKPTDDEIMYRMERTVAFWQRRDQRMDEDLALYRLTKPQAGSGELVMKNIPYAVVEKASSMIAAQSPTHAVIPAADSASETAQKIENFVRWSWERWNKTFRRAQIQGSLRHTMAHFLCLRGWAALRVNLDSENEDPRQHPVEMTPYDPRQIYPSLGKKGLKWVVHEYYATVGEVMEEWEEAAKAFGDRDPSQIIKVRAYYDNFWHHVIADEQVIKKTTAHDYGYVPWVIVTGYGSPIRATSSDQQLWTSEVGVSIFHGIRDTFKSLNRVLSQIATEVAKAANPPGIYYYDPQDESPKPIRTDAGAVNFMIYDRERYEPIDLSPKPQNVAPLIDSLLDDIDKGSLPRSLWGSNGGSGFLASIDSDSARDALFPIIEAMQEAFEQVNELSLSLIRDHHDEEVGFYVKSPTGKWEAGVTLTADEIKEVGVETVVRYRDISPKDRAMMANLAALLTDKKLISMETARDEYLNLENPERENEKIISEFINMDEKVLKDVLVPLALEQADPKMALLWNISKMQDMMQGQQPPGGPPSGGPPPGPPGPMAPLPPGPPGPPGMAPGILPPIMQPGADPGLQSLGSILGGLGMQAPPGVPGVGGPTPPMPMPIL